METPKKKLAIVGGGAHTIPTYRALLKSMANEYQIILFSEFNIDPKDHVKEYTVLSLPQIKNRRWRELRFAYLVLRECFRNKVLLIHSHSTYPSGFISIIAGIVLRVPVLVSLDAAEASGISDIGFGDLLHPKRKRVNRWVMRRASALTTLTEFQKREVQSNLSIEKNIQVIPRGIDFSQIKLESRKPIQNRTIKFLNVAYIHPVKDQETLLKTFKVIAQHIDAKLTIVGKDYENGRLQQVASTLGIESLVHFVGFVPHENIQPYFNEADILLHTSRYESQAMVAVEAMASGVLVCGTRVGLLADLSGQCCVTVPTQDDEGLARGVVGLVHDEQKQEELRSAGLLWSQTHSLAWTSQQYLTLYDKLLDDPNPRKRR